MKWAKARTTARGQRRLTLTWDVLKWRYMTLMTWNVAININMRCIEINIQMEHKEFHQGLTLTWDVLKFCNDVKEYSVAPRLTLTWDVLKLCLNSKQ